MQNKRSICEALISGEWYKVPVDILHGYKGVQRRCPECKAKIKLMKKGRDGQKAHFEHYTRNSNCSESVAFGKHEEFGDNKHIYINPNQQEIDASYKHKNLLDFVLDPPGNQTVLYENKEELYEKAREIKTNGIIPAGQEKPVETSITRNAFKRDATVVSFVLSRANGACEACEVKAPFTTSLGRPYLEVHHMIHLANNGADTVDNTVAVCPNCHKELHYGVNSLALSELVYKKVPQLTKN